MATSAYDAFVSADGKADYLLPSAAFADGKTNIYVQPGTYLETSNVVLPAGARMTGSGRSKTIIDFASNNASVICQSASATIYSAGAVAIANASNVVTGTETKFPDISDAFIFLKDRAYAISSVTNDTELKLENTYNGLALSGSEFKIVTLVTGHEIRDLSIVNSGSYGLVVSHCRRAKFMNITIERCDASNVYVNNCSECSFQEMDTDFSAADGFRVLASSICQFRSGNALSNAGHGFYSDDDCSFLVITSMQASANNVNFYLHGANCVLTASSGDVAATTGCEVDGDTNKIVACCFTNSGGDNLHVLATANYTLLAVLNFNTAGATEFNNESPTTAYAVTYP